MFKIVWFQYWDLILVSVPEANSAIWQFEWFCPYFKGQLLNVTLNFTTQTMLLNGSSYNIYILWGMAAAVCLCGPCFDLIVVAFLTTRGPCDPKSICYIHGPDMSTRPRLFTLYCIYIGKGPFFPKKTCYSNLVIRDKHGLISRSPDVRHSEQGNKLMSVSYNQTTLVI